MQNPVGVILEFPKLCVLFLLVSFGALWLNDHVERTVYGYGGFAVVTANEVKVFDQGASTVYPVGDWSRPLPTNIQINPSGVDVATALPVDRVVTATSVRDLNDRVAIKDAWSNVGAEHRLLAWQTASGTYQITAQTTGEAKTPAPPSAVESWNGTAWNPILTDSDHVIHSFIAGPGHSIAITDERAVARVRFRGEWTEYPGVQPLLFLDPSRLVVRQGFELWLIDLALHTNSTLGKIPPGSASIHATIPAL